MYEYELEGEFEYEAECEWEGECEAEEFLGTLRNLAGRAVNWGRQQVTTPGSPLRRVALGAARQVVQRGLPALGGLVGGQLGQRGGAALGGLAGPEGAPIGAAVGRAAGQAGGRALGNWAVPRVLSHIPEREWESEFEGEWEGEFEGEMNPLRRVYADALMEHMGHAAATAQTEAEAEAFIGAMVPLVARAVPGAASAVMRAAPGLVRGLAGATRSLRRSPATRQLVRTLPAVLRRTAATVAQQSAQGRRVSPQATIRTLARQTAQVIGSPRRTVQAYRRSQALDRRYHQQVRRLTAGRAAVAPRCATCRPAAVA